jgi:hypothetical protein
MEEEKARVILLTAGLLLAGEDMDLMEGIINGTAESGRKSCVFGVKAR